MSFNGQITTIKANASKPVQCVGQQPERADNHDQLRRDRDIAVNWLE